MFVPGYLAIDYGVSLTDLPFDLPFDVLFDSPSDLTNVIMKKVCTHHVI